MSAATTIKRIEGTSTRPAPRGTAIAGRFGLPAANGAGINHRRDFNFLRHLSPFPEADRRPERLGSHDRMRPAGDVLADPFHDAQFAVLSAVLTANQLPTCSEEAHAFSGLAPFNIPEGRESEPKEVRKTDRDAIAPFR